jgi:carbamoyltransferase
MRILGLSAFYHDSAAALVVDGRIIAAAQEERFTRRRHDAGYPANAINYCLAEGGVSLSDIDHVVFYEKPFLKFERLIETYVAFAPRGFRSFRAAMSVWLGDKLFQKRALQRKLQVLAPDIDWGSRLLFCEHHLSHAASAYYPSPFEEAVVLTLDGVGEWPTTSVAIGRGNQLEVRKELHFPHSLGLLYSAFTYYTGFKVNSGEYKVMGLAPYGEPRFKSLILDKLIDLKPDGSFRLDMQYFNYCTGLTMTNRRFERLFGQPPRRPETELMTQFHMDLAASVQAVTEEVLLRMTRALARDYGLPNLCLAGGVALNCVANARIRDDGAFRRIFVQPAAGDAGGALGAALAVWHSHLGRERVVAPKGDAMAGAFLGPSFAQKDIETRLAAMGARFTVLSDDDLIDRTAQGLAEGNSVGWMQGRMEYGPRALGARSILADPRSPGTQKQLNVKIKFRESFRPFAPAVLREDVGDWFELEGDAPYMSFTAGLKTARRRTVTAAEQALFGIDKLNVPRSDIPAVTHVDYSARVQTVDADTNPRFHALLACFKRLTGCPVLVNTSFNVRGEPIVCTPEEAFRCFMGTDLDMMVAGNCLLQKSDQDPALKRDYQRAFKLD